MWHKHLFIIQPSPCCDLGLLSSNCMLNASCCSGFWICPPPNSSSFLLCSLLILCFCGGTTIFLFSHSKSLCRISLLSYACPSHWVLLIQPLSQQLYSFLPLHFSPYCSTSSWLLQGSLCLVSILSMISLPNPTLEPSLHHNKLWSKTIHGSFSYSMIKLQLLFKPLPEG